MEASFYPGILALAWIGIFLILGTLIRAKVKLFQKALFPSALIAGILGFLVLNSDLFGLPFSLVGVPSSQGWKPISAKSFSFFTFHLFAISFVGVGLLEPGGGDKSKDLGKSIMRGSLWMCLLFCMLWCVQAVIGFSVFDLFNKMGSDVNPVIGYLLGAGFTQGPGQAQSYGVIWESQQNIQYAVSAGLGFAAVGFLAAGVFGVGLTFYGIKKGWASIEGGKLSDEFRVGLYKPENQPPCAKAVTHPANVDSFAFHVALFAALYGLSYGWALFWQTYIPYPINSLGIGFTFYWALMAGTIARKILAKFGVSYLVDQETVRRLTGILVDFMLVAVFLGIAVSDISTMLAPFLIAGLLGAVATLVVCVFFGRRIQDYGFERMIALYGLCTGTAASGLLLVRIVDPEFKTPAAVEVGLFNLWAFFLMKGISWTMPFAPIEGFPFIWIMCAYIVVTPIAVFALRLGRVKRYF